MSSKIPTATSKIVTLVTTLVIKVRHSDFQLFYENYN